MDDNSLYDLLKKKAEDPYTKDEVMYYEFQKHAEKYTYEEVYELVNKYVDFFSRCDHNGKVVYLIVDNSVKSVAVFIAMLKVKIIPVLISVDAFSHITTIEKVISRYKCKYKFDFFQATMSDGLYGVEESFEKYVESLDLNLNLNDLSSDGESKFLILTSGSTSGKSKKVIIYEKDLLQKGSNCYDLINTKYFCTYIPISSISSIVYDLLVPLYFNIKIILMSRFNLYELGYKDVSLLVPRNILDFIKKEEQHDFSNIGKLYLSGEINSLDFIKEIRKKMPTLKENVFVNLYGSTEALGIISYCEENKLKPIYINQLALSNGEFIYTFDKVNFYKRKFINNTFQDEKINLEYDDFIYFECLPVSENKVDNVIIENDFGEIIYNDKRTGDIGIYVNNQLYIICRKNDVVEINNKKYYLIAIENLFSKFTSLKAIALKYNNEIIVIISFILDKNSTTNVKNIIPLIKKSYDLKNKLSYLPLSLPIFVDSEHIPKSNAMKKTIKNNLISIIKNRNKFEYYVNNYENCLIEIIQLIINDIVGLNTDTVEYQENNIFRIKKTSIFNVKQLILLFNQLDISNIYEKEDYFYFTFDDKIIINDVQKIKNEKIEHIYNLCSIYQSDKKTFYKYINNIKERKIQRNLVIVGKIEKKSDLITFKPLLIDDEKNINFSDYNLSYDFIHLPFFSDKLHIDDYILNDYDIKKRIRFFWNLFNHEYSIDYKKNFFVDGEKIEKNKNRNIIYRYIAALLTNYRWDSTSIEEKNKKINFSFNSVNNQLILVLNKKFRLKLEIGSLGLYQFDNYQRNTYSKKDNFLQAEDFLNEIIENLFIDKDNNPLIVINNLQNYFIQNDSSKFIFEIIKQDTAKRFLELVEMLKKHEPIIIKVDEKDTLINFSNLKVIYMVVDEELYKEPTIDKCIELGYPKEIIDSVDKITSYFGLVEEYKKSKVKRKELK